MEKRFLSNNAKIIIVEQTHPGLKTAMGAKNKSGKVNNDALKNFTKKLSDYYKFDDNENFKVPKDSRDNFPDEYEIEALGAGKMSGLKYDNEDTELYDSFVDRVDDLNDTSTYDELFGTIDGFGQGKKDNVYEKLKSNSEKYKKHKYEKPDEYHLTPKVRVTNESKNKKMKRLNFKNNFKDEYEMKNLIPEHYKRDEHIFLMCDGNQTFKVRWDTLLNEGTTLAYKNKEMINEDLDKMKKLFKYKYSDSLGKTNDYGKETNTFKTLFESVKDKKLID
tara:strand:- start:4000 stop:4830 length:831 start_codon:yes stop_codon:yes gene_type:complete